MNKEFPTIDKSQYQVAACSVLHLDLSIGTGHTEVSYASLEEARDAFCSMLRGGAAPMPTMIVWTGAELQIYWVLNQSITIKRFRQLSRGLVRALQSQNLKFDPRSVTTVGRLMRIPGTINRQINPPFLIELKWKGNNVPVEQMAHVLAPWLPEQTRGRRHE
jgi:hypothetical protein